MRSYDLVVTPTMECSAFSSSQDNPEALDGVPLRDHYSDWCQLCYPSNLTGQPAISVSMGLDGDGMPLGLQLIARRGEDALLIEAAAAWQHAVPPQTAEAISIEGRVGSGSPPTLSSLDGSAVAGMLVDVDGRRATARRAMSQSDGKTLIDIEVETSGGTIERRAVRAQLVG